MTRLPVRVTARDGVQSFFVRLTRELVRILEAYTGDGYVFRTDLRLRPDPASTPLAMSVPAALAYYESVGQNWERAALIKARPVAGDRAAGRRFLRELQPFIWRKNLDFAAIQDIHSIKRQINAHRGGGRIAVEGHDIKTGRGGIREIEFFAQTQQLIWGGRLQELRVGPTCEALRRLAAAGRIDPATAAQLIDDYRFLRRLEHRLADGRRRANPCASFGPRRDRAHRDISRLFGRRTPSSPICALISPRSSGIMPSFSSRPRRSPARAIWSSPAPMTIAKPCARCRSSVLPSRPPCPRWCEAGITADCAPPAASGRAKS